MIDEQLRTRYWPNCGLQEATIRTGSETMKAMIIITSASEYYLG